MRTILILILLAQTGCLRISERPEVIEEVIPIEVKTVVSVPDPPALIQPPKPGNSMFGKLLLVLIISSMLYGVGSRFYTK